MGDITPAQVAAMRQRADKAREFSHTVGHISYTLRRPPELKFREMVLTSLGNQASLERRTVFESVIAWQGPVVADVDPAPESPETAQLPLPCTPEIVELFMQDRLDHYGGVSSALMEQINLARAARDTAKKASAG